MKPIKAWAVVLSIDDNFIPDFTIDGKIDDVLQIHSNKKSARKLATKLGKEWQVIELLITQL